MKARAVQCTARTSHDTIVVKRALSGEVRVEGYGVFRSDAFKSSLAEFVANYVRKQERSQRQPERSDDVDGVALPSRDSLVDPADMEQKVKPQSAVQTLRTELSVYLKKVRGLRRPGFTKKSAAPRWFPRDKNNNTLWQPIWKAQLVIFSCGFCNMCSQKQLKEIKRKLITHDRTAAAIVRYLTARLGEEPEFDNSTARPPWYPTVADQNVWSQPRDLHPVGPLLLPVLHFCQGVLSSLHGALKDIADPDYAYLLGQLGRS